MEVVSTSIFFFFNLDNELKKKKIHINIFWFPWMTSRAFRAAVAFVLRSSWREGSLLGKYWSHGQALRAPAPGSMFAV